MRKQIAAANWKMNLTLQQAETLMDELIAIPHDLKENQEAVFGVPFPCGQTGLFVHTIILCASPIMPALYHSRIWRTPSLLDPWLPICVTTLYRVAISVSVRAS